MRQPNEYWLKYMLIHSGASYSDIISAAEMYGFIAPTQSYLQSLRHTIDRTKPKPFRLNSVAARTWMRRQRVMSLVSADKEAIKARDYLGDTKLRPVLEALLISDTEKSRIPELCKDITGKKVTAKSVKFFEHYFWNRNLLTLKEWEGYLSEHENGDVLISCRERGTEYALWKLGYRIDIEHEEVVRGVLHEATMRFFEVGTKANSKDTALTAKLWSEQIFRSLEELSKSGDAVQEVLEDLKNITIRLEKSSIKDIEALSNGNHSKEND